MPADDTPSGWAWLEGQGAAADDPAERELTRAFAHCFAGTEGQIVLDHLQRLILDRRLAPEASDAELRHLEGQRFAVAYIVAMIERGRA